MKNATAYTSSQKLLKKSAMHAVMSLLLTYYKAGNSGDISY